jgi:hypothetical protein
MFALRRRFRRRDLAWVEEHQELLPHPAQDHKVTAKALLKHEALTGDEILTLTAPRDVRADAAAGQAIHRHSP